MSTSKPADGVLYGVRAIAAALKLTEAETLDGIEAGRIPAFRAGTGYCASERELLATQVLRHARAS